MADDFDEFFDTPRQNPTETESSKNRRTLDPKCTASEDTQYNVSLTKKPPTHPHSQSANERTFSGRTSPVGLENFTADAKAHGCRRTIEAKVPSEAVKEDSDGFYSDDSFTDEDDGSSAEGSSGRQSPTPRIVNSDQRHIPKDVTFPVCDKSPSKNKNGPQDLSDSCERFADDMAESDNDSEVTDVSPLNSPHTRSPKVHTMSSATRSTSKSSKNDPVGLLHADRDSLDLETLLQTVLHMEKKGRSQSRQSQVAVPSRGSRRNYSFNNERVEAIDKENQRLMMSIMKHANDTKKAKAKVKKVSTSRVGSKRLSSAAVNRAKEQQKIEAENLMLLRRLQQTRPTKELRRDVLIGSQSAGRGSFTRPASAGHTTRTSSASSLQRPGSGRRARPTSAYGTVERYQCSSRPATSFLSRPDDDDILTWKPEDF